MVITDMADKKVSAQSQINFVKALEHTGRPVEHYIVQAFDDNRHGVVVYARLALTGCLRSTSMEEIARETDKISQRAAASRPKENERGDIGKPGSGGVAPMPMPRPDVQRSAREPAYAR